MLVLSPSWDPPSDPNLSMAVSIWNIQLSMHSATSCCFPGYVYRVNDYHSNSNEYLPNIITESEGGGGFLADTSFGGTSFNMMASPSLSMGVLEGVPPNSVDISFSIVSAGEPDERREGTVTKLSWSCREEEDDGGGLSTSISVFSRSRPLVRLPSIELGDREGEGGDIGKGSDTNRDGPSSTNVASVSFDDSVPPLSASSSSSSRDVTSASLANSTVGVTDAASANSMSTKRSASCLMTS